MGTRADFYIQEEKILKSTDWLGSIAWDGYPEGIDPEIINAINATDFLVKFLTFVKDRKDFTPREYGWPWPWEDSLTTDYAYVFKDDKVDIYCFGHPNGDETEDAPKVDIFPNMKHIQNIQSGDKSGLIVIK